MIHKVRASFVLLLFTLFVGTSVAHAVPSSGPAFAERTPGMLTAIWEWATSLVEAKIPFLQVHEASDGILPPPPPSGPSTDGGGFIDPNGGS